MLSRLEAVLMLPFARTFLPTSMRLKNCRPNSQPSSFSSRAEVTT